MYIYFQVKPSAVKYIALVPVPATRHVRFGISASQSVGIVSHLLQLRSLSSSQKFTIIINGSLTYIYLGIGLRYHMDIPTCPKTAPRLY